MEKETHTHTNFIKVNYYYRSISCNEKAFLEFHGEELSHRFANDLVLSSSAKEETGVFQINWISSLGYYLAECLIWSSRC